MSSVPQLNAHIATILHGLYAAGCGAEAAIGQLTCLTSLHMSVERKRSPWYQDVPPDEMPHSLQRLTRSCSMSAAVPLQLQQLGCSGALHRAGGSRRNSSSSGAAAAGSTVRNTGLQELSLECIGALSDDELAAAAGAMPDLRRLEVAGSEFAQNMLVGLYGARLAEFSACRRLRDLSLRNGPNLDGQELVRQLPQLGSLASLKVRGSPWVKGNAVRELAAAFQAEHGRRLLVDFTAI